MKSSTLKSNFFLISFLPAIAYWYLEENYALRIALMGGLFLAVLEIILEKLFTKHVHTLSKFNLGLILFLGSLSLLGDEGIWFKLQPTFTGIAIFSFLCFKLKTADGFMLEMMKDMPQIKQVPIFLVKGMEFHFAVFNLLYGVFMGYLAIWQTTDRWLFFKTAGYYISFIPFILFELVWMKLQAKKMHERQMKAEILKNF